MTRWLLAFALALTAVPQMPRGLPGRDSYAIRKVNPNEPCRFAAEYQKIKADKTDPRVAYIETESIVAADEAQVGFDGQCRVISQQTEDGIVVFDRLRGFLHIFAGDAKINTALAYFAGAKGSPGVTLYVNRWDDDWKIFVLAWIDGKWRDVTANYLGPLNLAPEDYLVAPQYGRTIRVLRRDGDRFRHQRWLTWDGRSFQPLDEKTGRSTWRCPESYRYFHPADRAVYCR
jgi:hypothetical protein